MQCTSEKHCADNNSSKNVITFQTIAFVMDRIDAEKNQNPKESIRRLMCYTWKTVHWMNIH